MLQKFVILLANGAQQLSCGSDLVDGNHALHNKGRARPRAIGGQYQYAREPSIRKGVTVPGRSQSKFYNAAGSGLQATGEATHVVAGPAEINCSATLSANSSSRTGHFARSSRRLPTRPLSSLS